MRNLLAILSLLLLMISCKETEAIRHDNILINDHKNMANLLFDIHLTEGMESSGFLNNIECKFIYTKIFIKHKVTPADFDSAVTFYAKNNDKHKEVYELVNKRLDSYLRNADKKFFNHFPEENANIWKDFAVIPDSLHRITRFSPYYICPKPEYLNNPLIINYK